MQLIATLEIKRSNLDVECLAHLNILPDQFDKSIKEVDHN